MVLNTGDYELLRFVFCHFFLFLSHVFSISIDKIIYFLTGCHLFLFNLKQSGQTQATQNITLLASSTGMEAHTYNQASKKEA